MTDRIKAGINTVRSQWESVFSRETRAALAAHLELDESLVPETPDPAALFRSLEGARVVLSTWGALPYGRELLEACPDLQLILYGAGAFKQYVTAALLERGPLVGTAVHLNAVPTAEFTLGLILCSLKNVFTYHLDLRERGRAAWGKDKEAFGGGYYRTRVGIVGYGRVARHLLSLLQPFEMELFIDSPYMEAVEAERFRVKRRPLDWIMANCDVVTIHHADNPENWNIINRENLRLMKPGARLINTSRGRMIDEAALVETLREGRITAYLDVTYPEPPEEGHPFYSLPNCVLTPHVAGSIGREVQRLGDYCLRELENWLAGRPLESPLDLRELAHQA